jgi:hypothetical protein
MRRPNTNVLIYHGTNSPPGPADATARVWLTDCFRAIASSEGDANLRVTARLEGPLGVDLRDDYPSPAAQYVYVINADGTVGQGYRVVFVERVRGAGTRGQDFKRAWLERVKQAATPIRTSCCPSNGLPATLYASFGGGDSIALVWTDHMANLFTDGGWGGYGVRSSCGAGYCLALVCGNGNWLLFLQCHAGDDGFSSVCFDSGPSVSPASATCDPFSLTFAHPALGNCPACDQSGNIVITP